MWVFEFARARRWTLCLVSAGILLPLSYAAWQWVGWPDPIVVGSETTHLTEPRRPGGYVDYAMAISEQIGGANPYDDPWMAQVQPDNELLSAEALSHARVPFLETSTRPPGGPRNSDGSQEKLPCRWHTNRLKYRSEYPFTAADDLDYATLVDQNEAWFQQLLATEPGPPGVEWFVRRGAARPLLQDVRSPLSKIHEELALRFRVRAMLAFGNGDLAKGMESIEFVCRVASRERELPFVLNQMVGSLIHREAMDALRNAMIHGGEWTEDDLERAVDLCNVEDALPKLQAAMETDRLRALAEFQNRHEDGLAASASLSDSIERNRIRLHTDWNLAMEELNQYMNELRDVRSDSYVQTTTAVDRIAGSYQQKWHDRSVDSVSQHELARLDHSDMTPSLLIPWLGRLKHEGTWNESYRFMNRSRIMRLTLLLRNYRLQHGTYPTELRLLSESADWSQELAVDAFTEQPFFYRGDQHSFELRSLGPNQQNDGYDEGSPDFDDGLFFWPPPKLDLQFD